MPLLYFAILCELLAQTTDSQTKEEKICDFRTEFNIQSSKQETRYIWVNICVFTEGMSAATRDGQTTQDLTLNRGGGGWLGGEGVQGGAETLPAKINRLKDGGSGRRGGTKNNPRSDSSPCAFCSDSLDRFAKSDTKPLPEVQRPAS